MLPQTVTTLLSISNLLMRSRFNATYPTVSIMHVHSQRFPHHTAYGQGHENSQSNHDGHACQCTSNKHMYPGSPILGQPDNCIVTCRQSSSFPGNLVLFEKTKLICAIVRNTRLIKRDKDAALLTSLFNGHEYHRITGRYACVCCFSPIFTKQLLADPIADGPQGIFKLGGSFRTLVLVGNGGNEVGKTITGGNSSPPLDEQSASTGLRADEVDSRRDGEMKEEEVKGD